MMNETGHPKAGVDTRVRFEMPQQSFKERTPAQRKHFRKNAHHRETKRLAGKSNAQKTPRILQTRRNSAAGEAPNSRGSLAECAHRHGPTAEKVPESASYGDAVVAVAASVVAAAGASVAGGLPPTRSMLDYCSTPHKHKFTKIQSDSYVVFAEYSFFS